MLRSLQKYKHVPRLEKNDELYMYTRRYDMDLLEATVSGKRLHIPTFARGLFGFLHTLHTEEGVFHGDIKPENICVNKNGHWVLVDWESARAHGVFNTGPFTRAYIGTHVPSAKADVYAAALTVLVHATRQKPHTLSKKAHEILQGNYDAAFARDLPW